MNRLFVAVFTVLPSLLFAQAIPGVPSDIESMYLHLKKAREIAGDRDVILLSPNVIQQALELGLVDEVCVSIAPALYGEGIPYFAKLDRGHVAFDEPVVVQGKGAVHLRYPVRR